MSDPGHCLLCGAACGDGTGAARPVGSRDGATVVCEPCCAGFSARLERRIDTVDARGAARTGSTGAWLAVLFRPQAWLAGAAHRGWPVATAATLVAVLGGATVLQRGAVRGEGPAATPASAAPASAIPDVGFATPGPGQRWKNVATPALAAAAPGPAAGRSALAPPEIQLMVRGSGPGEFTRVVAGADVPAGAIVMPSFVLPADGFLWVALRDASGAVSRVFPATDAGPVAVHAGVYTPQVGGAALGLTLDLPPGRTELVAVLSEGPGEPAQLAAVRPHDVGAASAAATARFAFVLSAP